MPNFYTRVIMVHVSQTKQVLSCYQLFGPVLTFIPSQKGTQRCDSGGKSDEWCNCILEQLGTIKSNKKSLSTRLCNRCEKASAAFGGTSLFMDVISYLDHIPVVSMRYLRQDLGLSALASQLKLKNQTKKLN